MTLPGRRAFLVIAAITRATMLIAKSHDFPVYHQAVRALFTSGWDGVYRTAGTWVVINELDDGNWGEGGSVLEADHVP